MSSLTIPHFPPEKSVYRGIILQNQPMCNCLVWTNKTATAAFIYRQWKQNIAISSIYLPLNHQFNFLGKYFFMNRAIKCKLTCFGLGMVTGEDVYNISFWKDFNKKCGYFTIVTFTWLLKIFVEGPAVASFREQKFALCSSPW